MEALLHRHFGYEAFRPGQREIIESILNGTDTLAILPTGGGKSVCYQFPSYVKGEGLTLILSPLLSLIEDQVMQIKRRGERSVAKLTSVETREEKEQILSVLEHLRYLYLSPEQLALPQIRARLKQVNIALFVVDEAHCISQWGHEFRPEYARLGQLRRELGFPQCLALTATATQAVERDIRTQLQMREPQVIRRSVNRPEIQYIVDRVGREEKDEALERWMTRIVRPCVIYTTTRKEAERIAGIIEGATYYHAGLTMEDRQLVQQQFLHDEMDCLVCTSAFGMGVDKGNVRTVIHHTMPATLEAYMQEIGRAGRDGKEATVILLYAPQDEQLQSFLIETQYAPVLWIDQLQQGVRRGESYAKIETRLHFNPEDPAYRLLKSQLENGWSKERIIQWQVERKQLKGREVSQMMDYIHRNECRRTMLLHHFDEPAVVQPRCCDICGTIEWQDPVKSKMLQTVNWKKRLEQVFFSSPDSV
ncbi:ATP-dependent DNA helicase RecQ [uncultured Exiguobacterium sp.]|uniref:RecQ family ATP-dependent DNA helicase n=1 Tax=uncultured Exiguobacterium sp. TaxID=202669 RepID=UPI0025D1A29F|nr:RecQ family ATP-dependent DNA helicase [uncultured Exiguobacterium sp.]